MSGSSGQDGDKLPPTLAGAVSERRGRVALAAYGTVVADPRKELSGVDAEFLTSLAWEYLTGLDWKARQDLGQADALDWVVGQLRHALTCWTEALRQLGEHLVWLYPAGLPPWATDFGRAEAEALRTAEVGLLRAVMEVHHGTSGPGPDAAAWWDGGQQAVSQPRARRPLGPAPGRTFSSSARPESTLRPSPM